MQKTKQLKDLNLMDRFLFAEAMEDPDNFKTVVEIIMQKEIELKYLPQTEKEERTSPMNRFIKLDVWAQDMEDTVYDTEVQKSNTGSLPKRSRYYQSLIDSKLLTPGEIDFNVLNTVVVIIIAPFDLFGHGKYMYTFEMKCKEVPELFLDDGAIRIFLNTKGRNPKEVSPELVELLKYMENTSEEISRDCKSDRIHQMHERIKGIKSSEEVGVRYMQAWEERELDRREALKEGEMKKVIFQVCKKVLKGKSVETIAEELEEDVQSIQEIYEAAMDSAPECSVDEIYSKLYECEQD